MLIADIQTAGRGRHGRIWQSPQGNLFLSILLRPEIQAARLGEIAFLVALAVADTVDSVLPVARVALKWPNDILLEGAKLSGILIESELTGGRADVMVVGIGINIAATPQDTTYPATCLQAHGATAGRDDIADTLLHCFAQRWRQWEDDGFTVIRQDWLARAWSLGAPVTVAADSATLTGQFDGIDEAGALLLATDQGLRRVLSGSLSYSRAA